MKTRRAIYWTPAVKVGDLGIIKPIGGSLKGLRVIFLGRVKGEPWVKALEACPQFPVGQSFPYKLKWIDWS